jgi:hypothetical protein
MDGHQRTSAASSWATHGVSVTQSPMYWRLYEAIEGIDAKDHDED